MKRVGSRYPAYRRKRRGGSYDIQDDLEGDDYSTEDRTIDTFANLDVRMARTLYNQLIPFALQIIGYGESEDAAATATDTETDTAADSATNTKDPWGSAASGLAQDLNITKNAPGDFIQYLPWFVAYDILQIKATNPKLDERTRIAYIKLSELMRTLPPKQEINKFSRWEEYYKDFKNGTYSGGKDAWLYNKRATTLYDPADPLFHFTPQRSRIEVRGTSPSLYGDYDVMRILNVKPEGDANERYKQGPFVGTGWPSLKKASMLRARNLMGGRMRRRAASSYRRI